MTLPAFCVSLDSAGKCNKCFGGYALNTAANTCDVSLSCNTASTCTTCAQGYTLSAGRCVACSLPANCASCSPTSSTTCVKCNKGFYLNAANACTTCFTNCIGCDSATFCNTAAPGYYVTLANDGSYSGSIALCYTLCATCTDKAEFCTTCIPEYTLQGSTCIQNLNLATTLVLGAASSGSSITSSTASVDQQLADMIRSVARILSALAGNLDSSFFKYGN